MPTNYEWLLHMDGEERQAWFDAEHVDNATCNNSGENVIHDSREKQAKLLGKKFDQVIFDELQDSREKLEADVRMCTIRPSTYLDCTYDDVLRWLNRQAEITRKTEQAAWIQQANGLIHEANVERDELRDAINVLQEKQPYCYDPDKPLDTIKTIGRYIDELQAKVDELAELNSYAWQEGFEKGCESRDDAIADWRAETDELHDELAKRDKGIARIERQRDEARRHISELEAERDELKRKLDIAERYEERADEECDECRVHFDELLGELEAERDALARDLADCERERERLRQALGTAIDHAHEIMALVDIGGEVM